MKVIENLLTEIFNSIIENVEVIIITPKVKFNPELIRVKGRINLRKR